MLSPFGSTVGTPVRQPAFDVEDQARESLGNHVRQQHAHFACYFRPSASRASRAFLSRRVALSVSFFGTWNNRRATSSNLSKGVGSGLSALAMPRFYAAPSPVGGLR